LPALFDEAGRRVIEIGYRDFGDHLHLNGFRTWVHASPDAPELQAGTVTTFDLAARLAIDPEPRMRRAIAAHPNLPQSIVTRSRGREDQPTRRV